MRERKLHRAFTLDILGEAVASESEADHYLQAYLDLIAGIAPTVNSWPDVPQIDRDAGGNLPRVNVSVKLSALDSQFDPIDPVGSTERAGRRLRTLLRAARKARAFVNVDMESYKVKDLTLAIFRQILLEDEFRGTPHVGIVIQAYLKDSEADLRTLAEWARRRGTPVWVRLVKGAYWDYETVLARQLDWPVPVFERKTETDANYERLTRFLLANHTLLRPALGSHNIRSLAHGLAVAQHLGLPESGLELQMLYGMGDPEKQVLVDMGYRMRIYMPYGELIPGMAYLVRRLLENTSNDSFLRASFAEHISPETLLMNPLSIPLARKKMRRSLRRPLHSPLRMPLRTFATSRSRISRRPKVASAYLREALSASPRTNWASFVSAVDRCGEPAETGRSTADFDRSLAKGPRRRHGGHGETCSSRPIARMLLAASSGPGRPGAQGPVEAARHTRISAPRQAAEGYAASGNLRRLAAWEVYECGKQWREADGDVCEAIDFCEFYAREAVRMQSERGVDVPGEENRFLYLPRGVSRWSTTPPWNCFPLAIPPPGMTTAALVTGATRW